MGSDAAHRGQPGDQGPDAAAPADPADPAGFADQRAESLRRMFPNRIPATIAIPAPPAPPRVEEAPRKRRGLMLAAGMVVLLAAAAVVAVRITRDDRPAIPAPVAESFPVVLPPTFLPEPSTPAGAPAPTEETPAEEAPTEKAPITGYSACATPTSVTFTATFTTKYEYRHVFIDNDNDAATGYEFSDGFGADYMIENDVLYKSAGRDWAWREVPGASPLVSVTGGTYRWRVRPGFGGPRVVFNAATEAGAELSSPVVPLRKC